MFSAIMYIFVLLGTVLMIPEIIFPYFPFLRFEMFKIMGAILVFVGVILYHNRCYKTTADALTPMPDPQKTKLLHLGKSSGRILTAKKEEPNRLRAKTKRGWMNIKDMGNAVNVAGHDFVISTQDDGHNYPLYLLDAISKWRKKWNTRNEDEFLALYEEIKNIKNYNELNHIEFLKPIMADDSKRRKLLDMSLEDLRNMRELLYDGRTIDVKAYKDWKEGATPYDNESIISSNVARIRAETAQLRWQGGVDWGKMMPIMLFGLIGAAIAYRIFFG